MRVDRRAVIGVLFVALAAAGWFAWRRGRVVDPSEVTPSKHAHADVAPPALAAAGREARSTASTGPRVPSGGIASDGPTSTRSTGSEPTLEDVIAAEGLSLGGVLRGVVLGLGGAAAHIELVPVREPRFVPGPDGTAVPQELPPAPATRRLEVASDGTFRLDDELPEGPWELTVSSPGRSALVERVRGAIDGATIRRLVLVYGAAELSGRVWRRTGEPAVGIAVTAAPKSGAGRRESTAVYRTTTDSSGAYVFRGLIAGSYEVRATFGDGRIDGPALKGTAVAAPDRPGVLDLGSPTPRARLRGVLRTRDGSVITRMRARLLWTASDAEGPEAAEVWLDGSFVVWLEPGRYTVQVSEPLGAWPLGPIDVLRPEPAEQDLQLTGSIVRGRVTARSAGVPRGERSVRTVILSGATDGRETSISLALDSPGTFEFVAVPPGRYRITGHPGKLRTLTGEPAVVDVEAGQDPATLELVETD